MANQPPAQAAAPSAKERRCAESWGLLLPRQLDPEPSVPFRGPACVASRGQQPGRKLAGHRSDRRVRVRILREPRQPSAHRSSVEEQVFLGAAANFGVESPVPVVVLETNTSAIGSRQAGGGSRGQPIDWRCACTHVSSDSLK
jgi:hypothetical protein